MVKIQPANAEYGTSCSLFWDKYTEQINTECLKRTDD